MHNIKVPKLLKGDDHTKWSLRRPSRVQAERPSHPGGLTVQSSKGVTTGRREQHECRLKANKAAQVPAQRKGGGNSQSECHQHICTEDRWKAVGSVI
jgi:hypothetical protein